MTEKLRVLVACEFSGVVRRAFRERGHDAWSCDLLPAEDGSRYHYQCDVRELLKMKLDLMIAHPPCTRLTNAGVRWLSRPGYMEKMQADAEFFLDLKDAQIPMIAVENPIPHKYARAIIGRYDQLIQPWQFGHGETKATCLWLKNLPRLMPTAVVEGRTARVHRAPPSPDRWKERSRTLPGIAAAFAEQWGGPHD